MRRDASVLPRCATVLVVLLSLVACQDAAGPKSGVLFVAISTSGGDLDLNGYVFRLDSATYHIATDWNLKFHPTTRDHTIALEDIADNCLLDGPTERQLTTPVGDSTHVPLHVTCYETGLRITTASTGFDIPPLGYAVNATPVTCSEPSQCLASGPAVLSQVGANGEALITRLPAGQYEVRLDNHYRNCRLNAGSAESPGLQTVVSRALSAVQFALDCRRLVLAFTRFSSVVVTDGLVDGATYVGGGLGPAWSNDGRRIIYPSIRCDHLDVCTPAGLQVVEPLDLTTARLLTTDTTDADPASSPDGTKIVFSRGPEGARQLHVMHADGSSVTDLTLPVRDATQAAWSPDGSRIAFSCEIDAGNLDVCLVNPDGSGLVRLTGEPGLDADPTWRPDGQLLAFTTDRFSGTSETAITTMRIDGSGIAALRMGRSPAWSPDGTLLAFEALICTPSGCGSDGVHTMAPDGSMLTRIAAGTGQTPAWRP